MSTDLLDRLLNEQRWSRRRTAEQLATLFQEIFAR